MKTKKDLIFWGENLIRFRLEAGLSQVELGQKVGYERGNEIHRLESGKVTKPYPKTVKKIAKELGKKPEDFYTTKEALEKLPENLPLKAVPFTSQERTILKIFRQLERERQIKIMGYCEGYMASQSEEAAKHAAQLSEAAHQATKAKTGKKKVSTDAKLVQGQDQADCPDRKAGPPAESSETSPPLAESQGKHRPASPQLA